MDYPGSSSSQATTSHWEDDDKTPRPTHQLETRDFHPDTLFNPTWIPGPNVAQDGTVVHPETYAPVPHPGYRDQDRRVQCPMSAYGALVSKDPKWWKNVAITEHDDAEFETLQARKLARIKAVEEQEEQMYYAYYGRPQRHAYGQGGVPDPYGAQPPERQ